MSLAAESCSMLVCSNLAFSGVLLYDPPVDLSVEPVRDYVQQDEQRYEAQDDQCEFPVEGHEHGGGYGQGDDAYRHQQQPFGDERPYAVGVGYSGVELSAAHGVEERQRQREHLAEIFRDEAAVYLDTGAYQQDGPYVGYVPAQQGKTYHDRTCGQQPVAVARRYDRIDDPLQEYGYAQRGGYVGGRAGKYQRQLFSVECENVLEPAENVGSHVPFPEHRRRGDGDDVAAPFLLQFFQAAPVHPSVLRVHDPGMLLVHPVEDHEVQPSVFFLQMQYYGSVYFPETLNVLVLRLEPGRFQSQFAAGVDDSLHGGAFRACPAGFPYPYKGQPEPVMGTY